LISTILRLTYDRLPDQIQTEFKVARVKAQAEVLKQYLGLTGNTVEQSISRLITEDLVKKAGVLQRVQPGRYRVDEGKLRRLLKGTIPADFPVPLGVAVD
jgi:predicted transcriptional regulator of viral defense system